MIERQPETPATDPEEPGNKNRGVIMSNTTKTIKVEYNSSVFTPAGWRGVTITAAAEQISEKRCRVLAVMLIDGKVPSGYTSRTGAKRQAYNAAGVSHREVGKIKNLSSLKGVSED